MQKSSKIYIAGHRGMVGSAIVRDLRRHGYENLVFRTSKELDLRSQEAVNRFMAQEKPDCVIIAAARVGGILANDTYPYPFLYDNLMIEANLINAAHHNDAERLVFLGSSCIYPKLAPQPLREDYLLTGPLEPTNQWYALAKIAGIRLCDALRKQYGRSYTSLMPTNLYGPGDNFDLKTSHVLPAMIRKFHEAHLDGDRPVILWGSGSPMREFLHVDDLARAVRFVLEEDIQGSLYNAGTGRDLTIRELAGLIQNVVGHRGTVEWDAAKPDGTPRKLLDVSLLNGKGWKAEIGLEEGVHMTYHWFLDHQESIKEVHIES